MDEWKVGTVLETRWRPQIEGKVHVVITAVNPKPGVLYTTVDARSKEGRAVILKHHGIDLGKLALSKGIDLDKLEYVKNDN